MEEQRKQNVAIHSLESEFVSYEQALALKELGFDDKCFAAEDMYSNIDYGSEMYNWVKNSETIQATWAALPLKQQVFRWFRKKYDLFGLVHRLEHMEEYYYMWVIEGIGYSSDWETYEESENACIDKLIEIVK